MSTSTCRRPVSDALILASVLLLASPVAADYIDSYRRGLEAANKQSWADAMRFMRGALAEQPREGEVIIFEGGRPEPYLPRYYLGLALFHTGNCVAARREWEKGKGAIQKSSFAKTVAKLDQDCQKRAPREAAASQSAAAVEADLRKAEKLAAAVAMLGSSPQIAGEERQALEKDLRDVQERLTDARAKLEDGRRNANVGDIAKARELTQRATTDIEKARRKAMTHFAASRPGPAAPPPTAPAPVRPPDELVSAAHAYFEGRYEDVVRTLAEVPDGPGPVAVQSYLLRAAARHALYALGGGKDNALLRAVTADVRTIRRLDPSFQPDAAAFSPRFRELFRAGG